MIDMIKNGGIIMIPILLCGVAATFIIIERIVYFTGLGKSNKALMSKIVPMISEKDYIGASIECRASSTPTSLVIGRALDSLDFSDEELHRAVETESARQYPRLERFLTALGIISNVATLLGLLGTVTGNIKAFGVLGDGGTMGNPALLAGSISEALVTTAAGLIIAIPSVIAHNFFVVKADRIMTEAENTVSDMMLKIRHGDESKEVSIR